MRKHYTTTPPEERFWNYVMPEPMSGCWLWTGGTFKSGGYGQFSLRTGVPVRAHRFSWELHRGEIPDGLQALHKCDVPLCVNPDHLFLGTSVDNMLDKAAKGRGHGGRKLTSIAIELAKKLRAEGASTDAIGDRLGVSGSVISDLFMGKSYYGRGTMPSQRLPADLIEAVRTRRSAGASLNVLCSEFSISRSHLYRIITGQR